MKRVDSIALHPAEPRQAGVERSPAVDPRGLPSRGERVAAEQRRIQRHAGLKSQPFIVLALDERERREVAHAGGDHPLGGELTSRRDACESRAPFLDESFARLEIVEQRGSVSGARCDAKAKIDGLLRFELDSRADL